MIRPWVPPLLLAIYGAALAGRALGGGLLVFDDHPGQMYRLVHAIELGPWPWRINPGWWAGYAELQYYPPGFAYAGAALHLASLGRASAGAIYQALLYLTFVLPAAGTYALLARVLGSAWLALPGAFVALTLSGDCRSGVEEGMRWGLVAARFGWGLVPFLALALDGWTRRREPPASAALLLAAIAITHPAHAPAGLALLFVAALHGPGRRSRRLAKAGALAVAAGGLAAFWLVPLLAHLDMALPLAWGDGSLTGIARRLLARPLLVCLALASAVACLPRIRARAVAGQWLILLAPVLALVIAMDALVLDPMGIRWLPADRLVDSLMLALVIGASIALGEAARRLPRIPHWAVAAAAVAGTALLSSPGRSEPSLTLWPRSGPAEWPKAARLIRGARLDDLWHALAGAPPGRVLFVRSGIPLDYRAGWRRPHSHITALTPVETGRQILNGTFTHPSPIAGLLYTGSSENRPITHLVEERDGTTLFGRPLELMGSEEFDRLARRLRVSAVVALDEDESQLERLREDPAFPRASAVGPFRIFMSRDARPTPVRTGPQSWRVDMPHSEDGWVSTGVAYSPLWHAGAGDRQLPVRRGELGLLEVQLDGRDGAAVELRHVPGVAEWLGVALSAATAIALALVWVRGRPSWRPG